MIYFETCGHCLISILKFRGLLYKRTFSAHCGESVERTTFKVSFGLFASWKRALVTMKLMYWYMFDSLLNMWQRHFLCDRCSCKHIGCVGNFNTYQVIHSCHIVHPIDRPQWQNRTIMYDSSLWTYRIFFFAKCFELGAKSKFFYSDVVWGKLHLPQGLVQADFDWK